MKGFLLNLDQTTREAARAAAALAAVPAAAPANDGALSRAWAREGPVRCGCVWPWRGVGGWTPGHGVVCARVKSQPATAEGDRLVKVAGGDGRP